MQDLTLVVMAAGMGSRFGGLKQITPVDDDGDFLIDYSVFDAKRAGFKRIVFVIKEENLNDFKETIGKRLEGVIDVSYAFQRKEDIPYNNEEVIEKRLKPWGTVQAVLAAKPYVKGDFAVINADDFYGYDSYLQVVNFFEEENKGNECVAVPFPFCETTSNEGSVKRGVLTILDDQVTGITECSVELRDDKAYATPLNGKEPFWILKDALVSMNMFGFKYSFMETLESYFTKYFEQSDEMILKGECLLPACLEEQLKNKELVIYSKPTKSKWLGMTYYSDLELVKSELNKLKETGVYPKHLWE